MMILISMLKHVKENLDDTVFEDHETLETLLGTLHHGCEVVLIKMKQIVRDEDDDCDCC